MDIPAVCCSAFRQIQVNYLSNQIVFTHVFKQDYKHKASLVALDAAVFITSHNTKVFVEGTNIVLIRHLTITN